MQQLRRLGARLGEWLMEWSREPDHGRREHNASCRRGRNRKRIEQMHEKVAKVIGDRTLDFTTKKSVLAVDFYRLADEIE